MQDSPSNMHWKFLRQSCNFLNLLIRSAVTCNSIIDNRVIESLRVQGIFIYTCTGSGPPFVKTLLKQTCMMTMKTSWSLQILMQLRARPALARHNDHNAHVNPGCILISWSSQLGLQLCAVPAVT